MTDTVERALVEAIDELDVLDAHTHLVGGRLAARGLHDLLLYHMVISDLYAAGCPDGARLTQFPGWPDEDEATTRIERALPHLHAARNTSTMWMLRHILSSLYGWDEPITTDSWRRLDGLVRERADDRSWAREVLRRAHIRRSVTEYDRRSCGADDDVLQYSLEWGFFTRTQWGEHDTALYELERCWGEEPGTPSPIGSGGRPPTARTIRTVDDVHAAVEHYVGVLPYDRLVSVATHLSTDIDYAPVGPDELQDALERRGGATEAERDVYASYVNEAFLNALEPHADRIVLQFSLGAEPLPFETASRLSSRTIRQLAEVVGRHPRIRFQCFLGNRAADQGICTLARELPNLSVAAYWWHNFFPSVIRGVLAERLDMLPVSKQVGFFSDAYCVEWAFAKVHLVKRVTASVLAEQVRRGQHSHEEAVSIAAALVHDTAADLLGMVPAS